MEFEWDAGKAERNLTKHGVSFQEAETVFGDPFELTIPDQAHSRSESRWVSVGHSAEGRMLVVVYVERETRFRLISARPATLKERTAYEGRSSGRRGDGPGV
ncbi:MAG: BrnT family toxin [Dehalococcoidia bacterium]